MSPIQIALLLLAVAGVWAVVELALTLRKTRTVVDSLDKTVSDLNNTLAEAQPVVAKLDGAVDELTPALAQVEPLLKSSKTAVDALTSNLVEVEAVVRDISEVTGSVAEASNAVSSVTDSAAGAVQKLFNKVKAPAADADRKLAAAAAEAEQPTERVLIGEAEDEAADGADAAHKSAAKPAQYYTYTPAETSEESCDERLARLVRMTAANVGALCSMSVDRIEDIRMAAEEAFIFGCTAVDSDDISIKFDVDESHVGMTFTFGDQATVDEDDQAAVYAELILELFRRYKETGDPDAREQLVMSHMNLVRFLANKFKNRGEPLDDLLQVGYLGLLKAIDRFDPERGLEFTTFATPTILGEIKRHFRDKGWSVRVPRRLQELSAKVNQATDKLTNELQRSPKVEEIADYLGVTVDEVLEAMESSSAYTSVPIEAPGASDSDDAPSILDRYADDDNELDFTDDRLVIEEAIRDFSPREREVIELRFVKGMTQIEIAKKLGISQVQVSRLLRRTLKKIQDKIDPDGVMVRS